MRTITAALILVALSTTAHARERYVAKTTCSYTANGSSCSSYVGPPTYDSSAKVISIPAPATYADALEAQARYDRWTEFCKPKGIVDDLGVTRLQYAQPGCEFGRSK